MNRAAIVTGASRGIGHGIATRLAERGYALTISARNQARLDEVATFLRARGATEVLAVSTDMADPDAAAHLIGLHREKFESLSTLVLNAGMATTGLLGDYEMRGFDEAIEVNLRAPFALLQEALPLLREWAATEPQHGAKVIAL
jgi:3-oxoacyl-[acyl-carrier protein] reductase